MRVRLLMFFWGHKPGTKGRINDKGKLILKGSPPATLKCGDIGTIFEVCQ